MFLDTVKRFERVFYKKDENVPLTQLVRVTDS